MNKPRTILAALVTVSLLLSFSPAARASDPESVLADYTIASWTTRDGLPTGTIRALAQDADGFLWLGGDFGLVRFDGATFVQWNAVHRAQLPQQPVQTLRAGRDGSLWVGFGGQGGISRIRHNQITTLGAKDGLKIGAVATIVEDRAGNIISVCGGELFLFLDEHWARWNVHHGLADGHVQTAYVGPSGNFFIAADSGIFRRRQGEQVFQLIHNNNGKRIQDIAEDQAGRVWITDISQGTRALSGQEAPSQPSEGGKGSRLLTDAVGNLWVGTLGQGLWRIRTEGPTPDATVARATDQTGLSNNSLYALLEDRNGNVWAGTSDGLNRLISHTFKEITHLGLATGLDVTRDGHVWIGTSNGLARLVKRDGTWQQDKWFLRGSTTRALFADANDTIWVATDGDLYRIVNGVDERVADVAIGEMRQIAAITSDLDGDIWLYDLERGLFRWKNGHVEAITLPYELRHIRASIMHTDRSGRVWIGFVQGQVVVIDGGGAIRSYGTKDGLPDGPCRAIYEDAAGTVWIASNRGLTRFNSGRFVTLRKLSGTEMSLTSIIDDAAGTLWFGNTAGVARMDPTDFDRVISGWPDQVNHQFLDASAGVGGTAAWSGQRSAIRSNDGLLWFLTARGLTIVDPRKDRAQRSVSPVEIDNAVADDGTVEPTPQLRLSAETRRLEINYAVPDLVSPLKTRFRYRLEGFDTDWIDGGTQRKAIYTNLPHRAYLFHIQASKSGEWAQPGATWAFSIQPRFYETWAFYVLSFGFLVIFAGTIWRLRVAQLRTRFALVIGERVRLGREIHDTLLQSLVGVALQFDRLSRETELTAQSRQERFVQMRKQLEFSIREARESIVNLRSLTPPHHDLPNALRQAGERAIDNNVAFELEVRGTPRGCEPTVEHQMLRIAQEALTNAIRHSQARRIAMELRYEENALTLLVSDDGCGFEPTKIECHSTGHFGITSMQERAKALGGALRISSVIGAGTVVETTVRTASN